MYLIGSKVHIIHVCSYVHLTLYHSLSLTGKWTKDMHTLCVCVGAYEKLGLMTCSNVLCKQCAVTPLYSGHLWGSLGQAQVS